MATTQELFEEAYRAYLRAVKQSWADVDVNELVEDLTANNNVMQGCGEAAFNCLGSVGTAGTAGTIGGTAGTFGTLGTIGCHVTKEADAAETATGGYDGDEST